MPPSERAVTAISYGHAGKLAATAAGAQAAGGEKPALPINPVLYRREDVRRILAARDIAALYQGGAQSRFAWSEAVFEPRDRSDAMG